MKNHQGKAIIRFYRFLKRSGYKIFVFFGYELKKTPEPALTEAEKNEQLSIIKKLVEQPIPLESSVKRVEIIVLKYKDPEVEVDCAKNILENTDWPYKMVFYDNRVGVKNTSKIWNKLFREATCDYVLIIDSDAFVPKLTPCWLTRMMSTFEKYPDCYVVVPKITRTSCDEQRADMAEEKEPTRMTEFFAAQCVLFKKEIFNKVGWLDEDFLFYGQDSEWAVRTMKKGYPIYLRHDVLINHLGHYSAKKAAKNNEFNRKIEAEYAQKLFEEKTALDKSKDLEFTGEFFIPGKTSKRIALDHLERYKFASKYVKDKTVLDIACGSGYGSNLLASSGAREVLGVDILSRLIEYNQATYRWPNLQFQTGDISSFSNGKQYDVITCFETIEHIDNYLQALLNLKKLLKPGGLLIISSPNLLIYRQKEMLYGLKTVSAFHKHEFMILELKDLLIKTGFTVNNSEIYGQRFRIYLKNPSLAKRFQETYKPDMMTSPVVSRKKFFVPGYFLIIAKKPN
ncbi:MAG: bifunctional glycosyltransferase/class I SAM-dependent methyltransferase [Candidatus Komeilibacteria bacterium]|nr:bifunctional glycosyltransferase/class I SAM-dependent methyltransferase [Candidatus Komeilibacteria bacterium]